MLPLFAAGDGARAAAARSARLLLAVAVVLLPLRGRSQLVASAPVVAPAFLASAIPAAANSALGITDPPIPQPTPQGLDVPPAFTIRIRPN